MAYTVFEKNSSRDLPPSVTITAIGRIGLNSALARIFNKYGVQSVLLLSDIEERKIALQAVAKNDKRSYRIAYAPDLSQAFMSATRFLKKIGWDGKLYDKIPAHWDGKRSLLEFKMPKWNAKLDIVATRQKAG